ncbi:uncharacterized protein K452DRAFT_307275 [Aplosporella prunicola CBS 121167]|uniref:Uncharacterized protein n=1 Tax=Aplosporella prunicola CBS 121167 TaxID=1176127 RepID=A0A6A6BJW5_9PEZI|nr:uncharacterized protein K452DRAFT_307275 [Aplosporella prunicola CBS 121167]KAF2143928.1 hypothetical protein K452DRAFT_307275 [Aplosporella prunicola CBS 121167]
MPPPTNVEDQEPLRRNVPMSSFHRPSHDTINWAPTFFPHQSLSQEQACQSPCSYPVPRSSQGKQQAFATSALQPFPGFSVFSGIHPQNHSGTTPNRDNKQSSSSDYGLDFSYQPAENLALTNSSITPSTTFTAEPGIQIRNFNVDPSLDFIGQDAGSLPHKLAQVLTPGTSRLYRNLTNLPQDKVLADRAAAKAFRLQKIKRDAIIADETVEEVKKNEYQWFEALFESFIDTSYMQDNTTAAAHRYFVDVAKKRYDTMEIQAACWEIIELVLDGAQQGFRRPSSTELVKRILPDEQGLKCTKRLFSICVSLREEKTICVDVLEGKKHSIEDFVYAPMAYRKMKTDYRFQNNHRFASKEIPSGNKPLFQSRDTRALDSSPCPLAPARNKRAHSAMEDEDNGSGILSGRTTQQQQKKPRTAELYHTFPTEYRLQHTQSRQASGLAPYPAAQPAMPTPATSSPYNVITFQAQAPSHNLGDFNSNRPSASSFTHSSPSDQHATVKASVPQLTNTEISAMVAQQLLSMHEWQ